VTMRDRAGVPRPWRRFPSRVLFTKGLRKGCLDLFRVARQRRLSHQALEVLVEGMELLRGLRLDPRISEGTLLGAFREQNFISHDTDVDVALVGPIPTARLVYSMYRSGFVPVRLLWSGRRIQQLAFLHREAGDILDVVVWWPDSDTTMSIRFPEIDYCMSVAKDQFGLPAFVTICGRRFPTHSDPRAWLEAQYGDDWGTPEVEKTDWRSGRPFGSRSASRVDEK